MSYIIFSNARHNKGRKAENQAKRGVRGGGQLIWLLLIDGTIRSGVFFTPSSVLWSVGRATGSALILSLAPVPAKTMKFTQFTRGQDHLARPRGTFTISPYPRKKRMGKERRKRGKKIESRSTGFSLVLFSIPRPAGADIVSTVVEYLISLTGPLYYRRKKREIYIYIVKREGERKSKEYTMKFDACYPGLRKHFTVIHFNKYTYQC